MVRAFLPDPIEPDVLHTLLRVATRTPSAGFCQGVSLVVLRGSETARYWDTTLAHPRRASFAWPRLLAAPVLVLIAADPRAYTERYEESDKAHTGLGAGADRWPQPMWFVDAGMTAMALLYAATGAGLGACFFGVFDHEAPLKARLGIPDAVRLAGTVALGHPDPAADRPSRSSGRPRRADVIRYSRWE